MKINGIATAAPQASYPTEIKLTFGSKEEFDNFVLLIMTARDHYHSYTSQYKQAQSYLIALGR